jgi:hypothetical protein
MSISWWESRAAPWEPKRFPVSLAAAGETDPRRALDFRALESTERARQNL